VTYFTALFQYFTLDTEETVSCLFNDSLSTALIKQRRMEGLLWTMSWEGCESKRWWYVLRYYLKICLEWLRKFKKTLRISELRAENRISNIPHTKRVCYPLVTLWISVDWS